MSIAGSALDMALDVVAVAYPPAAGIIAIAKRFAPYGGPTLTLIKDAVSEGPAAFAAAKEKAPNVFNDLKALADQVKKAQTGDEDAEANDHEVATVAANMVGVDPPGWDHDDYLKFLDRDKGGG